MMKTLKLILITLFAAVSCSHDAEIQPCPEIIPNPAEVHMQAGTFDVAEAKVVLSDELDSLSREYLTAFADHLSVVAKSGSKGKIVFKPDTALSSVCPGPLGKEENYSIEIKPRKITVRAAGLNGFVYAVQTLKQLMPAQIYGQIVRLNAMLQEYAGANRIKYVDYHSAMKDDHGGLSTELAKDGVHPTREGYDIMKSLLLKALK